MKYSSYEEVPFYKKQLFFWIMFFVFFPISVIILLIDDIYYQSNGELKSFGIFNKIVIIIVVGFAVSNLLR